MGKVAVDEVRELFHTVDQQLDDVAALCMTTLMTDGSIKTTLAIGQQEAAALLGAIHISADTLKNRMNGPSVTS